MFDDIENALKGHLKDVADWRKKTTELQRKIARLEKRGVVQVKPYWRTQGQTRYLYLIHPMRNGERVREYIGADPKAQSAALMRVDRWEEYEDMRAELAEIQKRAESLSSSLRYTTRGLW